MRRVIFGRKERLKFPRASSHKLNIDEYREWCKKQNRKVRTVVTSGFIVVMLTEIILWRRK